jgi:hypothetical protein
MSARATSPHEWVDDFRASVAAQLADIHPSAPGKSAAVARALKGGAL